MSLNVAKDYYEQYWTPGAEAPPDTDPLTEDRVKMFLRYGEASQGRLLDAGCGGGRAMSLLSAAGYQVTGVDISVGALGRAQTQAAGAGVCAGALDTALPFAAGSFGTVFSCEVIEHLVDVPRALAEMCRVLEPGGKLFLSTPYHGTLKNLALALHGFDQHFDPAGPHIRFFSLKSLTELLNRSGFRVTRTFCLGRFWPLWMNMLVWAEKA